MCNLTRWIVPGLVLAVASYCAVHGIGWPFAGEKPINAAAEECAAPLSCRGCTQTAVPNQESAEDDGPVPTKLSRVIDLQTATEAPTAIVISDAEIAPAPLPSTEVATAAEEATAFVPPVMPYCDDDAVIPKNMPYADNDALAPA